MGGSPSPNQDDLQDLYLNYISKDPHSKISSHVGSYYSTHRDYPWAPASAQILTHLMSRKHRSHPVA